MRTFESYFNEYEILQLICKVRVKLAKNKSKKHLLHLLTSNPAYNYHVKLNSVPQNDFEVNQKELTDFLLSILPPRKRWVQLGEKSRRKPNKQNEFLTSNDRNYYSLLKTIYKEKKKEEKSDWYHNLQNFINEIIDISKGDEYEVSKPIIIPKLKDKKRKTGENECRPICIFNLKDRIILSLTNKFLTRVFDIQFQDNSFAFRAKRNSKKQIISHHDCILSIGEYRFQNSESEIFVAECDMKKFYDTVNHKITLKLFQSLIETAKENYPTLNFETPIKIFKSYLDSFAFNIDIPKQTEDISKERIGVPQGGALSGLIANIYLNQADIELKKFDVFYQRFCDDMIILAKDFETCDRAKNTYVDELTKLKLFPHKFKSSDELKKVENDEISLNDFWNGKSKGPYKWGKVEEDGFPWIGFVGYEMDYLGNIRVRKKSLIKELSKQKTIIREIRNAIKIGMRKPKRTATESAINRLIGMSVGRIGLDNFDEVSTDMCWKNGFRELTVNPHSIRQIKQLDRNRSKHYYKLLKEIEDPELERAENDGKEKRKYVRYDKPFSYFHQIIERQKKANR
ncbi:MAG: reverse transcriptase/maturase family protein [Flavobacterium sp.]|nr:reverse transcriptase/maturase family protein [Flavobacterium sp.]